MVKLLRFVWILIFLFCGSFQMLNAQTAAFTYDHGFGCPPALIVTFTDQSTPGADRVDWDFGNGNSTFRDKNNNGPVQASYSKSGVYTVTLKLSTGSTATHTITVFQAPGKWLSRSDNTVYKYFGCRKQSDQRLHLAFWGWNLSNRASIQRFSYLQC
jgi:uncharacterized iron-regulated membrane protein